MQYLSNDLVRFATVTLLPVVKLRKITNMQYKCTSAFQAYK